MNENEPTEQSKAGYLARRGEMLRLLERHLHTPQAVDALAQDAYLSRSRFQHEFRRVVGEAPAEMSRRLRLERAAHALRTTQQDVASVGFDAGYESAEGFSRAFRRAYAVPPGQYRELNAALPFLPGSSGVHYDSRNRGLRATTGNKTMDLTNRLLENDYWAKKRLLESALSLTDMQLDAPLAFRHNLVPFAEPEKTLREALGRMTGDIWAVALLEELKWPTENDFYRVNRDPKTVSDMLTRLETFFEDWRAFVRQVNAEDLWETTWVDAACEPAETFSYGTVIEATLSWGIAQRMVVQRLLEQMGVCEPRP